jgi:hypothetical protein
MSRWGVAALPREPFLYALDPETEGEAPTPDEVEELVQAVARTHIAQTAAGLGLLYPDQDPSSKRPTHRGIGIRDDPEKRLFAGMVVTPFGPLALDLVQARELSKQLPDPSLLRFIGLEEELLSAFLQDQTLVPRPRSRISDHALVGPDGLVVAPVSEIVDQTFQGGVA